MAAVAMSPAIVMLLFLNLTPYGAPELRAGAFWKYRVGTGEMTMRIVEAAVSDAGTSLKVELSVPGQPTTVGRAMLAPDRRSVRLSEDAPSGDLEKVAISVPEIKAGARLEIPEEGTAIVKEVQPQVTSTPAGDFATAIKVSLSVPGDTDATVWIAPGVGLLAAGERGVRVMELADYGPREAFAQMPGPRLEPPLGPPMRPMMPGPPGGAATPALIALDDNTFVVADPVTRTVTVFVLTRSADREWLLTKKAAAPYGGVIHPAPAAGDGRRPPQQPPGIPAPAERGKPNQGGAGNQPKPG